MNERLEATIICCAKLATGSTPSKVRASFIANVLLTTSMTRKGLENFKAITIIAECFESGYDCDTALSQAGF